MRDNKKEYTIFSLALLFTVALFGVGCDNKSLSMAEKEEANSSSEKPNRKETNLNNKTTDLEMEKSYWKEYILEEYKFFFRYPPQWVRATNVFNVKTIKYNEALESGEDGAGYEKRQLDLMKLKLEEESEVEIGTVPIGLVNKYDVPGGSFYREAYFFIDKDLIRLIVILPIEMNFQYPKDKDQIQEMLNRINKRDIDKETLQFIDAFDQVVKTLRFIE